MTQANTVDADAQLEAMLSSAAPAADPAGVLGSVVSDGEMPSVVSSVSEAGWTTVYHTRTGEPRVVMSQPGYLRQLFTKVHNDQDYPDWLGKVAFTDRDPGFRPESGKFKCMLHGESPDRATYTAMGLPVCRAGKLRSQYDVVRHMQRKHRDEWGLINEQTTREREQEDRDFQRQVLKSLMPDAVPVEPIVPDVVPTEPPVPIQLDAPEATVSQGVNEVVTSTEVCEECGKSFTKNSPTMARAALLMHKRSSKNHSTAT
jgi:hypothetical protein